MTRLAEDAKMIDERTSRRMKLGEHDTLLNTMSLIRLLSMSLIWLLSMSLIRLLSMG